MVKVRDTVPGDVHKEPVREKEQNQRPVTKDNVQVSDIIVISHQAVSLLFNTCKYSIRSQPKRSFVCRE